MWSLILCHPSTPVRVLLYISLVNTIINQVVCLADHLPHLDVVHSSITKSFEISFVCCFPLCCPICLLWLLLLFSWLLIFIVLRLVGWMFCLYSSSFWFVSTASHDALCLCYHHPLSLILDFMEEILVYMLCIHYSILLRNNLT